MASRTERPRKRLSPKPAQRLSDRIRAARRQRARNARSSRRRIDRIDRIHHRLPVPVHDVFSPFEPAFTRPTYRRFVLLALAAILTTGGHTIANLLRCLGPRRRATPAVIPCTAMSETSLNGWKMRPSTRPDAGCTLVAKALRILRIAACKSNQTR